MSEPSRLARARNALRRPPALRKFALLFVLFAVYTAVRGLFDPEATSASGYLGIALGLYALARAEKVAS